MKIKVLILQAEAVAGDIKRNTEKAAELLQSSGEKSCDLIVLPELWTTGWDCSSFNKYSEEIFHSEAYYFLREIAKQYNSNVIGGSAVLKRQGGGDRNTSLIFDRAGKMLGAYDKYHLFSHRGQSEGTYLESGSNGLIINTDIGKIGMSICYDIRFPELFRMYAFNGADLFVNVAAWPQGFFSEYKTLVKARAIENQIYVISSCLTGKINDDFNFSGGSFVSDYRGRVIAELEREEKVLSVEINLDEMKEYRQNMPILNDCKKEYKLREI